MNCSSFSLASELAAGPKLQADGNLATDATSWILRLMTEVTTDAGQRTAIDINWCIGTGEDDENEAGDRKDGKRLSGERPGKEKPSAQREVLPQLDMISLLFGRQL